MQTASSPQSYCPASSSHDELIKSLLKSLSSYTAEHYPLASYGVYFTTDLSSSPSSPSPASIAILLASNKYSPKNFWNARWRSSYLLTPSADGTAPATLSGTINVTVHYYEDGNVNLSTSKSSRFDLNLDFSPSSRQHDTISAPPSPPSSSAPSSASATTIIRTIKQTETAYQIEVNKAFVKLNEDGLKGLRRHLPITRQKVDWEKVGEYKLGGDLQGNAGGGSQGRR